MEKLMIKNLFLGAAVATLLGSAVNANELHEHHAFTAVKLMNLLVDFKFVHQS